MQKVVPESFEFVSELWLRPLDTPRRKDGTVLYLRYTNENCSGQVVDTCTCAYTHTHIFSLYFSLVILYILKKVRRPSSIDF